MIESWGQMATAISVAVLLFWVPGALALLMAHLRTPFGVFIAVSPVLSTALFGVAAILLSKIEVPWSPLSALVAVMALSMLLGGALRSLRTVSWRRAAPTMWRVGLPRAWVGAFLGGAILVSLFLWALPNPNAFEQTFDTAFHLNAVQYVVQTGDGSALTLSEMTGESGFYPAAWHDLGALIVLLTGVSVPLAANALNGVIIGMIWPVGMAFLAWSLWRESRWVGFAAGVLSAAVPSYPFLFFYFGSLYPNLLGVALLPAALVIGLRAFKLIPQIDVESTGSALLVLGVAMVGLGLAHPNALLALFAAMAAAITARSIQQAIRSWTGWSGAVRLGVALLNVIVWGVLAGIWSTVRPDTSQPHIESGLTTAHALGEVLSNAQGSGSVALVLSIFALIGGAKLLRRRDLFPLILWLITATTYVLVAAGPWESVSRLLGGVFYQDFNRIAALLAIPTVLISAYALGVGLDAMARSRHPVVLRAVSVLALIPVLIMPQLSGLEHVRWSFKVFESSVMIRSNEMDVVTDMTDVVPNGDRVMIIPISGGVFAYALTGREVTPEHFFYRETPAEEYIREHIDEPATPMLCQALEESDVRYLLDFDRTTLGIPSGPDLEDSGVNNTSVLDQSGDARLLKITACNIE